MLRLLANIRTHPSYHTGKAKCMLCMLANKFTILMDYLVVWYALYQSMKYKSFNYSNLKFVILTFIKNDWTLV